MSSQQRPIALKHLITSSSATYAGLLQQVQVGRQLQHIFAQLLPTTWRDHIEIAKLDSQTLAIYTDTPAWASKLRYLLPELTENFKTAAKWPDLRDIQIRILPGTGQQARHPAQKRLQLSADTALLLQQTSQDIADAELSQALLRLARHAGK